MSKRKPTFSPESYNPNYEERRDRFVPAGDAPQTPAGEDAQTDDYSLQNRINQEPGVSGRCQAENEDNRQG